MEIPFYTSFKEFKDNYETDLEKWLSIYPDGDEMDYLGCVYERYSDYAVTDISGITIDERCYKDKEVLALVNFVEVEGLPEKYEYKAEGFQVKYKYYDEGNGKYYRVFTIKELVNKIILMINKVKIYYTYIENKDYKKIKELLEFSSSYTPYKGSSEIYARYTYKLEDIVEVVSFIRLNHYDYEILFDNIKYNNFKLSIPKIYKFISDRRKEINGVQTTDEVTPTAEEQHTTGEEHEKTFTNPQKIKILDTLNIRGWLQDKGLTMFQIEVLLSDLFDISTKSIRNAMSNDIHSDFAENYIKELKQKKAKR
ncbi:hypothetical protein RIU05_06250 [Riemerella anatipestifer]|uniref:hypothetical protein n=1 Tax=Riemerella anatipestifer TaxID=34085 RepID=UPI0028580BD5|nr:hypothetical protein [Riemerella anatipestifer]MDR7783830.1 hypothetical protein [Riemerella anatipestifer]